MNNLRPLLTLVLTFAIGGCSKSHEHQATAAAHAHEHKAPHGGTAVVLGNEAYHLEFVHTPATGTLTAYVLDAHMENFIRLNLPSFDVVANVSGETRPLTFRAVANSATGETVGDTSQFEVQADWLKSTTNFTATLKSLTIRGTGFTDVSFSIP
jgi:hypothetical protein